MSTDNTISDAAKKLKVHSILSVLILVIGVLLLVFMITVEDEPGLLPLLLVVVGTGWYLITRARMRSHHE